MGNIQIEIGHHGTFLENLESILEKNFVESLSHEIWLGDGVYFFVEGICDSPIESAYKFSIDQRTRKRGAMNTDEVCVLEAKINVDDEKYINLDVKDGLELFNLYRDEIWQKIEESGKKPTKPLTDIDILSSLRKEIGIEFVKKSVFIKFGLQTQKGYITSFVPNVTIFAVNNPAANIELNSINRVK